MFLRGSSSKVILDYRETEFYAYATVAPRNVYKKRRTYFDYLCTKLYLLPEFTKYRLITILTTIIYEKDPRKSRYS